MIKYVRILAFVGVVMHCVAAEPPPDDELIELPQEAIEELAEPKKLVPPPPPEEDEISPPLIEEILPPLPPPVEVVDKTIRALAHITTDKPVYKPLDVMFIEVFVIDPTTKAPTVMKSQRWNYETRKMMLMEYEPTASFEILDGNDENILESKWQNIKRKDGTIVFTYKIPKG